MKPMILLLIGTLSAGCAYQGSWGDATAYQPPPVYHRNVDPDEAWQQALQTQIQLRDIQQDLDNLR